MSTATTIKIFLYLSAKEKGSLHRITTEEGEGSTTTIMGKNKKGPGGPSKTSKKTISPSSEEKEISSERKIIKRKQTNRRGREEGGIRTRAIMKKKKRLNLKLLDGKKKIYRQDIPGRGKGGGGAYQQRRRVSPWGVCAISRKGETVFLSCIMSKKGKKEKSRPLIQGLVGKEKREGPHALED